VHNIESTKDDSVDFPFYVLRNFLPNPDFYRKLILENNLINCAGLYSPGDDVDVAANIKEETLKYICDVVSQVINDRVWYPFLRRGYMQSIAFRRQTVKYESLSAAHIDRHLEIDYDINGKTIFGNYKHWALICDLTPIKNSARFSFCENQEKERFFDLDPYRHLGLSAILEKVSEKTHETTLVRSNWTKYKDFFYEYNTALLFPSNYFHTVTDIECSEETPRALFSSWVYSGFNHKYFELPPLQT
jgi:hypothetical protein